MSLLNGPVLFVTGHAPPDRQRAFALLSEQEDVEFALFGGRLLHGAPPGPGAQLGFPHRYVAQQELATLVARGPYRAVICSTGGRLALPITWAAARATRRPLLLWTSLWAHPRSPVHALSFLALSRLYRSAQAVVTYGPHVSAYVQARGARNVHVAPQAVDNDYWAASSTAPPSDPSWPSEAQTRFLFVGRPVRGKGLRVLMQAWLQSGLQAPTAALVLVGVGPFPPWAPAGGAAGESGPIVSREPMSAEELRNFYAAADVLVLPSVQTRTFREPWGLVVNEAMNQQMAIVASEQVGAAAGGLVQHERNGLVVPAGDSAALAQALRRLAADPGLPNRLGASGARDVRAYSAESWARGFSAALASLGLSRGRW